MFEFSIKDQQSDRKCIGLNKVILSSATFPVCTLALMLLVGAAQADVYRYHEDGSITYGDRAPMSSKGKGHSVLNNQGVVLENVLSREERREQRRKEREAERLRIRDRTLLDTFTTEEE